MFKKTYLIACVALCCAANMQAAVHYTKKAATEWHKPTINRGFEPLLELGRLPNAKHYNKKKKPDTNDIERLRQIQKKWLLLSLLVGMLPFTLFILAGIATLIFAFWLFIWPFFFLIALLAIPFWVVAIVFSAKYRRKVADAEVNNGLNQFNNTVQPQDVVYLKNGSVIKGKVLSATPGGDIKIEIAGGSVLVYKLEEVEKMVKE